MSASKQIADNFIRAMRERPDEISIGVHYIHDKKTGYQFWIANGMLCLRMSTPYAFSLNLIQRYRLWRAIKWFKAWKSHDLVMQDKQETSQYSAAN